MSDVANSTNQIQFCLFASGGKISVLAAWSLFTSPMNPTLNFPPLTSTHDATRKANLPWTVHLVIQEAINVSSLQRLDRSGILSVLNYHCRCIVASHLLAANSKLVENFQPSIKTRCSVDNKEKLSANIRSAYASDFCHDRKSAFNQEDAAAKLSKLI